MKKNEIKELVRSKYSMIARQPVTTGDKEGCCNPSICCQEKNYTVFSESYKDLPGYSPDADLGLGCGIPTEFAGIKTGDHILDLGSGAGNDCFVARSMVGETGMVTGLDFSEPMLEKARENSLRLGYENVFFIRGDIEQMPFADNQFDVILSNCVLNLVPDKTSAFEEMMRVLKPGGHFCVSDVVLNGTMSERLRSNAEMYVGCVAGAIQLEEYTGIIERCGFQNVMIHKKRKLDIPEEIMQEYMDDNEINDFINGITGVYSITISAEKIKSINN
jgi:arsenite methyltransferase